jgi:ribosomal-protein-alanine N-acetyltransferase
MRIRYFPAKCGHIAELDALNRASMAENYPVDFWKLIISEHLSMIAKYNGVIVGYILVGTLNGELSVISLAVDVTFRGNRIGKTLLHMALTNLKKNKSIHLSVRVSNSVAINLYKKEGFSIVKMISNYYNDPQEDGIEMILIK